jgi:hypothetical protein
MSVLCDFSKNKCFGGTYCLHLQGKKTLEYFQLGARLCLTTDGDETLLHGTSTVEFIRYSVVIVYVTLILEICFD